MTDSGKRYDVAIIGAGQAGRAAARAAAKVGAKVALIDEGAIDPASLPGGVTLLPETAAWGLFRGGEVGLIRAGETSVLHATSVIIATGACDVLAPFPGWTLAGVFACDDALRLLDNDGFAYKHVVVVCDNSTPVLDARIADAGGGIVARVTSEKFTTFRARGGASVEAVSLDGQRTPADAIVMHIGRQPDDALARMAGATSRWRPELGGNVPLRDALLRVNGSWCWVAGDAAGLVNDSTTADTEGALTGECAALVAAGKATDEIAGRIEAFRAAQPGRMPESAESRSVDPLGAWLGGLADDTIVCRCEGIDVRTIRAAIGAGTRSINDVKRRTRAGMGSCQGAWCTRTIGVMLADAGVPELDPAPMTSRPPSRLVTVGQLARLRNA